MARRVLTTMLVLLVILAAISCSLAATNFTVGGDRGWIVPNSGLNYTVWANNITAHVGDSLYFKYNPNAHTVLKVNSTSYAACITSDYLQSWDTGDTAVLLQDPVTHYFICGALNHCAMGQAFAIDVHAAVSDEPPATSPPGVLSPPNPEGSSAVTITVQHSLLLLAIIAVFQFTLLHW